MDKAKTMKNDLQKIRKGLEALKSNRVLRGLCFLAFDDVKGYMYLKAEEKGMNVKLGEYWFDSAAMIKSHGYVWDESEGFGDLVFEWRTVEAWYAPRFKFLDELIEELNVELRKREQPKPSSMFSLVPEVTLDDLKQAAIHQVEEVLNVKRTQISDFTQIRNSNSTQISDVEKGTDSLDEFMAGIQLNVDEQCDDVPATFVPADAGKVFVAVEERVRKAQQRRFDTMFAEISLLIRLVRNKGNLKVDIALALNDTESIEHWLFHLNTLRSHVARLLLNVEHKKYIAEEAEKLYMDVPLNEVNNWHEVLYNVLRLKYRQSRIDDRTVRIIIEDFCAEV